MSSIISIKRVLAYYIQVLINGDLPKLQKINREVEDYIHSLAIPTPFPQTTPPVQREVNIVSPTTSSSTVTITMMPTSSPEDFYHLDEKKARCAIPTAMSLLATMEFVGSILKENYKKSFPLSLANFLEYSGYTFKPNEKKVLAFIYRHGMMHGFFPQGEGVAVSYDSVLDDVSLLVLQEDTIILNVKALDKIVCTTLPKLFYDESRHNGMQKCFNQWYNRYSNNTENKKMIRKFKESYPD